MLRAMLAAVIPCYRVKRHVLDVLAAIPPLVDAVYVVDDGCPEGSGDLVESSCRDPRVRVLRHPRNLGVGAATVTGYRAALADGATWIVRLDGDGQMDPGDIPLLVRPLADGEADYAKGNRFYELEGLAAMPRLRLLGNSLLSFACKLSSGYWNVFDPNNGFTAIHADVLRRVPLAKLARGWFFESDLLFRLGTLRAVVRDVPMPARYGEEESSLVVRRVVGAFAWRHLLNTAKRIFYNYYLRDFNIASIELALGVPLLAFGAWIGLTRWIEGSLRDVPATSGTVMLAALPVIVGMQLVLGFLNHDMQSVPRDPLHRRLRAAGRDPARG
jgi:glycosyltransferase involved in cell wall biosynthesis